MARKAFYTMVPTGPSYAVHSARYRVASVASYLPILVFFPQERFRIPVIDPALIVSAALLAGLHTDERTDSDAHV